ncbi:TolC family protein [Riemerella anatipestifer]|uniref:TolC family protein n=1 Tax=Riemerella anatipestifer TaxID=34085 RepID=UPI000D698C8A|nr:TolC family protein [Riemerella anatipestifer]MBT0551896.1 TolC family protein [Riemerella anatipestifer]MBT0554020.1 TolC family protein [Riemerella anatipestifer]MCE3024619.1 TolC family protein [Riemerella anatipestifer]MCU7560292.1 TolC family protein [Riemerella anatipestifer]MDY3449622.1 TolC family protein [Riemerella anatipestifer]
MLRFLFFIFFILSIQLRAQQKWSLRQCVEYAVKNNLKIIQNNYQKNIQDKNLEMAKKEKLPMVSGAIANTTSFGQNQDIFGNLKRNDNFSNNANISANITVYNYGRLNKNIKKIEYEVEASQYDTETIKNDISLQIAQQYLSILLNKEIAKINLSTLQNAQKMYNRAKITTEVGTTSQTVLAEAEAALVREKQNTRIAEINIRRSLFDLAQLLMIPDYNNFDIEDLSTPETLSQETLEYSEILAKAQETQPQIKAANSRINAAKIQIEVVKTNFYPTITVSMGIGTFYFNSLVTNITGYDIYGKSTSEKVFFQQYINNFGQQIGLNINIPIFNKGITKLQVEQAKLNENIAKNVLEQTKLEIKQNIQKAQFDAEVNYETYLAAMESEKSSKLALDFAEKSYEAGRTTIYDFNIARNNYVNAKGATAQAKYNYLFSIKLFNFYKTSHLE